MMNDIGTKVKIKLVSKIIPTDGELETYEMWLQGSFINKSGSYYLRYEEVQEDNTIRTTVKLTNDQAFIMRSGSVSMRLPLNVKQKENGHYDSMYGSLPLVTKTHQLSYEPIHENSQGRFYTQYDLIIDGTTVGNYTLEIQYSEVQ
ncbi:DUF1934 domain-containing protein [Solibacillus sp. CAU 1738]|uniref:DUF1934 domain-containing protein n=1 Tax=Solibacillus sp. CAU 1738 TaxID=3140363 RepID=UPI0032614DD8